MKTEAYLVEGMMCSGCERTIQKVIQNLPGVESALADVNTSTVTIHYNPDAVSIERIKSAVNNIGYKFVGERPVHGQREGRDDAVS